MNKNTNENPNTTTNETTNTNTSTTANKTTNANTTTTQTTPPRNILNDFKAYCLAAGKNPFKLLAGALVGIGLLLSAVIVLDMSAKRFLICAFLSLGVGACIALPKGNNRVNLALLVLYLWYAPLKIFQRMELPVHDLSRLRNGVTFLSVWLILCVYLALFLVTYRTQLAIGIGNLLLLFLFLTEYFVYAFRGTVVTPNDLSAVGTAMTVVSHYEFRLSQEAFYTVLYLLFFTAWGFRIQVQTGSLKYARPVLSASAGVVLAAFYFVTMHTSYMENRGIASHYADLRENHKLNGTFLSFLVIYKEGKMVVPAGYSAQQAEALAADYIALSSDSEGDGILPDIILIMNEAWSDLDVLGDLETTEEEMPFLEGLKDRAVSGRLYASVWGGLTANTEFEALTGDSLSLLSPATIPYMNQLNHEIYALPRVLKAQGYDTMAMHPSTANVWKRDTAYEYMGFDTFISVDRFQTPKEYVRGFVSDGCNFNEIIWQYEHRDKEKPFFLFDVTIQNHGGYHGEVDLPIAIEAINGTSVGEGDFYDVRTYLNLVKLTDDSFAGLLSYFAQAERPVVLCMFGDHQPRFEDTFYETLFQGRDLPEAEKNLLRYETPYIIWTNYAKEEKSYGDFSANYLSAVLMDYAGLETTPYYQFLMNLKEEYPVLSLSGCVDRSGNVCGIADIKNENVVNQYSILQYNHIYAEHAAESAFMPAGRTKGETGTSE